MPHCRNRPRAGAQGPVQGCGNPGGVNPLGVRRPNEAFAVGPVRARLRTVPLCESMPWGEPRTSTVGTDVV